MILIWSLGYNLLVVLHKIYRLGQASKAFLPAIGKGTGAQLVRIDSVCSLIVDPMIYLGILGVRATTRVTTMGIG